MKNCLIAWLRRLLRPCSMILVAEIDRARWERELRRAKDTLAYLQSRGTGIIVRGRLTITDPKSVAMGHRIIIGEGARFETEGGLTIGDNVILGRDVTLSTLRLSSPGNSRIPAAIAHPEPIIIERNVRIGSRVFIGPGTHIGAGAVVQSGSVVAGVIPAGTEVRPGERLPVQEKEESAQRRQGGDSRPSSRSAVAGRGRRSGQGVHGNDPAARLFFVVSTGRSGTHTIAAVLSQHSRIVCSHEPRPQMIRLSTELAHGGKTAADAEEELRAIFCESSVFPPDRLWGESDQKYWNLVPLLSRLLPESRFLWLIRDGRDVVASTLGRNWFPSPKSPGHPLSHDLRPRWLFYRLNGGRCGVCTEDEWAGLPLFEKHCWHWAHVNSTIEKDLSSLPGDRHMMVRLETLSSSTAEIFRFLGLEDESVKVGTHNKSLRTIEPHSSWNAEQREAFDRRCGSIMDRWYPGWRK